MKLKLLLLLLLVFYSTPAAVQVPVADYFGRWLSKTASVVQQASQLIEQTAAPFVETFKNTQEFLQKSRLVISKVLLNLRYIERTVDTYKDIQSIFETAIQQLNARKVENLEEVDFLDKWKHAQILLAISTQATSAFEIFDNVLQPDAFVMDDKGRIQVIKNIYSDLLLLKRTMKLQLRRINREIYQYRKFKKELDLFQELFGHES